MHFPGGFAHPHVQIIPQQAWTQMPPGLGIPQLREVNCVNCVRPLGDTASDISPAIKLFGVFAVVGIVLLVVSASQKHKRA